MNQVGVPHKAHLEVAQGLLVSRRDAFEIMSGQIFRDLNFESPGRDGNAGGISVGLSLASAL